MKRFSEVLRTTKHKLLPYLSLPLSEDFLVELLLTAKREILKLFDKTHCDDLFHHDSSRIQSTAT